MQKVGSESYDLPEMQLFVFYDFCVTWTMGIYQNH
jgi:hypothetical protein